MQSKTDSMANTHRFNTGTGDSTILDMNDELTRSSESYFNIQDLDGQLADSSIPSGKDPRLDYNKLDEPILDTLIRDLRGIYSKMKIIALPLSSYDIYKIVLKGWDLWGPLLLCTFLAFNLHHSNGQDDHVGLQFADVFVLVWFGSCVVSLNYRLLSISSMNNPTGSSLVRAASSQLPTDSDLGISSIPNRPLMDHHKRMAPMQNEVPFQTLISPPSIFQLVCVLGYCLVAPCFGLILLKIFTFGSLLFERIIIGLLFGFAWPTLCSVRILIRYQQPMKRALAIYPIALYFFVLSCMIILDH